MGAISFAEGLRRLNSIDLEAEIRAIVEANKDEIADMVRDQLDQGLDGSGKKMAKYKNPAYARKKYQLNPRPGYGIRDQRSSGRFQEGIHVYTDSKHYTITSSDPKTKDLVRRDGELLLAFSPENKNLFRKNTLRTGLLRAIIRNVHSKTATPAFT